MNGLNQPARGYDEIILKELAEEMALKNELSPKEEQQQQPINDEYEQIRMV